MTQGTTLSRQDERRAAADPAPPPAHCGIPNGCARIVPAWLVALDNVPTAVMFLLGAALLWPLGWAYALLFLAYCAAAIVMFWGRICPHCHHFDTRACPCGYGAIAPRFFRRRTGRDFRQVFRRNIAIMFPCWFVPFGAGIYLLRAQYAAATLALFLAFCVIGFVAIPLVAKLVGCAKCEVKHECPWMSRPQSHREMGKPSL